MATHKLVFVSFAVCGALSVGQAQTTSVSASVETAPARNSGDAADDAAVWVHPSDSALSLVLGTDKQGGLAVYDLSGREVQFLAAGNLNNVDIRYNFPLNGQAVDIVTAGNRSDNSIEVFKVNAATRRLEDVAARTIGVGFAMYGSCMYRSATSDEYYAIVNSEAGRVEQWRLFDNGAGRVDATRMRNFSVGSQTEGCVADDELGFLYIGEEDVGIWKYGAEPGDGTSRTRVDSTNTSGHLAADVEGLSIYYAADGEGYLLASSQGTNDYTIYQRSQNNAFVGRFNITSGGSIDGTNDTDGIDVTNVNLGSAFPSGFFIAQDGSNSGGNQNFKLVPWERIANGFSTALRIDTSWNPRTSAAPLPSPVAPNPPTNLTVN